MGSEEGRLLEFARKQYSVFTHQQAIDFGMSGRTIRRRVADRRWLIVYRSVYAPSGLVLGWEQQVFGSCLACGPDAVASFSSAELIWEFAAGFVKPHLTMPSSVFRRRAGIEIHRSHRLDAVGCRGFRVTHPMRTLLDLAPLRSEEQVERYVDDAHRRGLIGVRRFQLYLAEPDITARPGAAVLRELLRHRDPDAPIGSDLETIFFRALRDHGLPIPVPQHPVMTRDGQKFIDFAYPDIGLAIELDGYADRANRAAFDRDRARHNVLEELGWSFRRFTWTQVRNQPSGVACTVGLALGLRPVRWKT